MPELPEVEAARRAAEAHLVGRRILSVVVAEDEKVLEGCSAEEVRAALQGRVVVGAGRKGKHLWLLLDQPPMPLFHFGRACEALRFEKHLCLLLLLDQPPMPHFSTSARAVGAVASPPQCLLPHRFYPKASPALPLPRHPLPSPPLPSPPLPPPPLTPLPSFPFKPITPPPHPLLPPTPLPSPSPLALPKSRPTAHPSTRPPAVHPSTRRPPVHHAPASLIRSVRNPSSLLSSPPRPMRVCGVAWSRHGGRVRHQRGERRALQKVNACAMPVPTAHHRPPPPTTVPHRSRQPSPHLLSPSPTHQPLWCCLSPFWKFYSQKAPH
ncbi:unnamed protein product [Closterium sp. NIES-53]